MDPPASYGTVGAKPPVLEAAPSNLTIVFEWVALLPLVLYLASNRIPHDAISDFLQQPPDFLDRASSASERRRVVWDVNWGSKFPCANGAATDIVAAHSLRRVGITRVFGVSPPDKAGSSTLPDTILRPDNRRYQTLHLLDCSSVASGSTSRSTLFSLPGLVQTLNTLVLLILVAALVVAVLFGLYGTTAAIFVCIVFRICRHLISINRPGGYLRNKEGRTPGYMLVALHENASTWYLYRGSRSVIDSLLNKAMIESIDSSLGTAIWLGYLLRVLEILQLVAMTYVAGQKGWDGVALLCLIVAAGVFDLVVYSDNMVATSWFRHEGVAIKAQSFEFSGRTPMIGAIQVLSGSAVTSWMDDILVPSARRDVWLSELGVPTKKQDGALPDRDREWIDLNRELTVRAVDMIRGLESEETTV
ncbi:unnamed protein product [Parascedosporium putredinis]|uniref:Uncharacterized protein n=1 Tax=Parascedosporium putredinis TaxID=1442378 RepID=A0A9P1H0E2_9PEZI|nr:unnamed protein product [Parascedosporium putredinis]CAI7993872.1 unnamed protein product [Parascedosporium putredinis]